MRRRLDTNDSVIVTVSSNSVSLEPNSGATATIQVYKNGELASDGAYSVDKSQLSGCSASQSGGTVTITATVRNTDTSSAKNRGVLLIEGNQIEVTQVKDYKTSSKTTSRTLDYGAIWWSSSSTLQIGVYGTANQIVTYKSGNTGTSSSSGHLFASCHSKPPAVGETKSISGYGGMSGTLTCTRNNTYSATVTVTGDYTNSPWSGTFGF